MLKALFVAVLSVLQPTVPPIERYVPAPPAQHAPVLSDYMQQQINLNDFIQRGA
jgi:hypothetical protein